MHPDFLQRHRALLVADDNRLAAETVEPLDDMVRVFDTAAEKKKLGVLGSQGEGQFVIQAAVAIADHLVFIDHHQLGTVALE